MLLKGFDAGPSFGSASQQSPNPCVTCLRRTSTDPPGGTALRSLEMPRTWLVRVAAHSPVAKVPHDDAAWLLPSCAAPRRTVRQLPGELPSCRIASRVCQLGVDLG